MTIEWGSLGQWAGPAVAVLIALWAAFSKRGEQALQDVKTALTKQIGDLANDVSALRSDDARAFERIDRLEADMTGMKVELKHVVTKDELHAVDVKLARIDEKIDRRFEALGDKMDTVIEQTERAQDRLAQREDDMIRRLSGFKGDGA